MIPKVTQETIDLGDGRTILIETGKLAKQADGSVVVRLGDCMLLATAVSARTSNPGVDFLPLTVDYREKFAAAGRFPGGFFKREARPSDSEVEKNRHDYNTERSLVLLVGKRRSLLDYLEKKDINRYREIIKELGIRK